MRLRRFQSVESGANNVVFIRTLGIEPEKLVHHILQDMYKTKKKKTRVILRMLPVSGTCKAFLEDMKKYAETFLEAWFKAPKKGPFQIVYKSQNNSHRNPKQAAHAGNEKAAHVQPGDTSHPNDTAEGENQQQPVPEDSEELGQGQRKPGSETQVVKEGGAKPELASQVPEGSKSNENDLSEEKKNHSVLEVSFCEVLLGFHVKL
ncbi:THUMP domain-containing protein 1 [Pteropus alecto]|uniref:THUMP domain-containing protein 1 n=1 Tax=Pteropus alecto TaxID=9402 RepID=L5KNG9_PTEAL|nr:THUMP domain-containing protein 1 [Pteropus alecto]